MQKSIVDVHFLLTVIEVAPKAKVIILQSWDFLPASIEQTINEGAVNVFTFSPPNAKWTFRSDLPFLLLTVHLKFCRPKTHCFPEGILTKKKTLTLKVCIEKRFQFCSQMYLQYQQTKPNFRCKIKQNWMQGWHYGKGLIYYKPIFRLTKLAFSFIGD